MVGVLGVVLLLLTCSCGCLGLFLGLLGGVEKGGRKEGGEGDTTRIETKNKTQKKKKKEKREKTGDGDGEGEEEKNKKKNIKKKEEKGQ